MLPRLPGCRPAPFRTSSGNPRLKRLRQQGVRLVILDQVRDGQAQWRGATVDDVRGGVLAAEHLEAVSMLIAHAPAFRAAATP